MLATPDWIRLLIPSPICSRRRSRALKRAVSALPALMSDWRAVGLDGLFAAFCQGGEEILQGRRKARAAVGQHVVDLPDLLVVGRELAAVGLHGEHLVIEEIAVEAANREDLRAFGQ